jgi:hypothetical protein
MKLKALEKLKNFQLERAIRDGKHGLHNLWACKSQSHENRAGGESDTDAPTAGANPNCRSACPQADIRQLCCLLERMRVWDRHAYS